MSELKKPTVGRIVHYFHNEGDGEAAANQSEYVPAIVTAQFGSTYANMTVFPDLNAPITRSSVNHKSEAHDGAPYWDWPVIDG